MYSLPVRILIVLIAASFGTYKLVNGNLTGYMLIAAAVVIGLGYFWYGPIRPAFTAIQCGDIDAAKKYIATIKFPNSLSPQSRAYWHWINAVIASHEPKSLAYAEEQINMAIDGRLRTSHDRCVATATLAQIVAEKGDFERANALLDDAERIPHREVATEFLAQLRAKFAKAQS